MGNELLQSYDPYAAIGLPKQNFQQPQAQRQSYGNYGVAGTSLAMNPGGNSWMTPDYNFDPNNLNLGNNNTSGGSASGGSKGFENFALAGQGVLGLAQAYQVYEANKLAKKQLKFQQNSYNQQLANQGLLGNIQLRDKASREAQMAGNRYGDDQWSQSVAAAPQLNVDPIQV